MVLLALRAGKTITFSQTVRADAVTYYKYYKEMIMSEPVIADKKPAVLELEAGKYYWCSCGSSSKQPFCDGSHAGTEFTPLPLELAEPQRVALCNCKHTGNAPFCDGAHSKL